MNITEKILKYLLILSFFILVLVFLIFPLTDLDIWMHLVTGKYILENFTIPTSDIYSYTAFGHPWIDHEWLSQIIFYSFYQLGGANALIILRIILFLLIFYAFFAVLSKKTNYFLALLTSLLVLLVSHERFFLRPETFTLLFVLIYIFILDEYRLKSSRLIYLLPVLQILWVNLHGYFLLGIVIPFLFLIGHFLGKRNNRAFLSGLVLLIILVSFINPYTYQGVIYPFKILASWGGESRSVLKYISELKSPFVPGGPSLFWFKFLIFISALSFLLRAGFKKLNLWHLLLYLLFLTLGITVKRHIALFAFPVSLITVYNLTGIEKLRDYFLKLQKIKIFSPVKISILLLMIAYLFIFTSQVTSNRFYLKTRLLKTFDLGLTSEIFPEKAIDFLIQHNLKGHIFNDMVGGSYLVWRYYPQRKVFLDGRTEVYLTSVFEDYLAAFRQPQLFKGMAQKYNIDYVLINYSFSGREKLIKHLLEAPGWALVYFDKVAVVFIKNTSENKDFIDKHSVNLGVFNNPNHVFWASISKDYRPKKWPKQELFPYGFINTGFLFFHLGYPKQAEISFNKALELNHNFALGYAALGDIYSQQERYPQALVAYSKALAINPALPQAYHNLGRIYEKQGLISKAEKYYKKSISLNPYAYLSYYDLGFLYFEQKKFNRAIKPFKKSVKLNPYFGDAYSSLGASLANRGQFLLAKRSFQKAISLMPDNAQVHYNLGSVLKNMGKFNASISEFQQVLILEPDNVEARHDLALSYFSVGLVLKAQKQWLIIRKQDSENYPAKEYLKRLKMMGYQNALD